MALTSNRSSIETLWLSILPKSADFKTESEDEEIVKLNLLLKATLNLVTDIRQNQLAASRKSQCITEQLRRATQEKELSDAEVLALQNNVASLKNEVKSADARAKSFRKEAQTATAKYERMQSTISAQVDIKVRAMFDNFLQQNRNGTALAMMTQVYLETQPPESAPFVEHRAATLVSKVKQNPDFLDVGSPEVIPLTPEVRNTNIQVKICQRSLCKPELPLSSSVPSSPDLIHGTPSPPVPISFPKKDNKKRRENFFKLYSKDSCDVSNDDVGKMTYVKDTQDEDESPPVPIRSVLGDMHVVPPTYEEANYVEHDISSIDMKGNNGEDFDYNNEKENQKVPPPLTNSNTTKMAIMDELLSTPKKELRSREKSPILGNSSSKKASNLSKYSMIAALPLKNQTWPQARKTNDKDISKISSSGSQKKTKKQVQQSIQKSISKMKPSKLSLNKSNRRTDISKKPEFNGGQRCKDLSFDVSHLSKDELVQSTISNSVEETSYENLLEDSDVTMFEPQCSNLDKIREVVEKEASTIAFSRNLMSPQITNSRKVHEKSQASFEPMFASTMNDEAMSSKRKSPTLLEGYLGIGKPLMSSTEKNGSESSQLLHELTALMDEKSIQDTMPYPLETSYDHLPKVSHSPDYAYAGPTVRKKAERQKLPPGLCKTCGEFFDMAFGDDQAAKKAALEKCTRCRSRFLRAETPPGYWNPLVNTPTQDIRQQQQQLSP